MVIDWKAASTVCGDAQGTILTVLIQVPSIRLLIGGTTMASSLGMALGPVVGGLIYDTFASYAWLFIGAFSLGLGAFLAALAFRRLPRRRMTPAAA